MEFEILSLPRSRRVSSFEGLAVPTSGKDRYVVIDGYKRIAAFEQLGRDTVEAVVWPMSEAAAVLLDRSLRLSEHETALEVGWLLAEPCRLTLRSYSKE